MADHHRIVGFPACYGALSLVRVVIDPHWSMVYVKSWDNLPNAHHSAHGDGQDKCLHFEDLPSEMVLSCDRNPSDDLFLR